MAGGDCVNKETEGQAKKKNTTDLNVPAAYKIALYKKERVLSICLRCHGI
jgi:hypothetical protein